MTSEKLYGILKFLDTLDKSLGIQTSLEQIGGALDNLVGSPAAPQHQSSLASALQSFESAVGQMNTAITPSQMLAIKALGGEGFFDPSIFERVKETVQLNAMTPTVARDFVQQLVKRRADFMATIRSARRELEKLKITETTLEAGSADLAFLIPRDIFDNKLGKFAKELIFISRLLQDFSEALTGKTEPVELEQLSSSIPTVALAASVSVIGAVAVVVNKFLDAWKKVEEIRTLRAKLVGIGMTGAATEQLTERIETTVDEVVEESTEFVLVNYKGSAGRKNELQNAIRQDARRLFGQIELGLTVEFRAEPKQDADEETQKALTNITTLGRAMQFPEVAHEPMLLKGEQVLEGDIEVVKHAKKTTIHKKTVSKKGASDDAAAVQLEK